MGITRRNFVWGGNLVRKVDTLRPFRTPGDVSASFFLLTNATRDYRYNNTIGPVKPLYNDTR